MAMKVTHWSPDTCGCVFQYEWDDTQDENTRVHKYKNTVKTCSDHAAIAGQPLYGQVLSENTRKNIAFAEIQKAHPQLTKDNYLWFWDADRVLQVSLMGIDLPEAAKRGLQTALDNRFGAGKVRIV